MIFYVLGFMKCFDVLIINSNLIICMNCIKSISYFLMLHCLGLELLTLALTEFSSKPLNVFSNQGVPNFYNLFGKL